MIGADSFGGKEEGEPVEVEGVAAEPGEARNGGGERLPWQRARACARGRKAEGGRESGEVEWIGER
jgi:hypothetical protein